MFALLGLLALVAVDYLRPQEYVAGLRGVPLLHMAAGLALLGYVVDLRIGLTKLRRAPHLLLALAFFAWCILAVTLRGPGQAPARAAALAIPLAIYLLVAHGLQTFRALEILCGLLLALSLVLAAIGVHQGLADPACYRVTIVDGDMRWNYDGRPCETRLDCEADGDPGADYSCEKEGLFGTSSINGRVRFRGSLEDPNELALVLAMALPFSFAFYERKRSLTRMAIMVLAAGSIGLCTLFTQSRGGQLVFLTVLGIYFVKRVGIAKGLALGMLLALPVLLLGGRSGAEDSTMERLECWWVGMHLFASSPVVGIGTGLFIEHHRLTAHNSYILAAAELGLPGMVIWSSNVYLATKIPVAALRAPLPPVARIWALAILASVAGMAVGVMFLSFNYKTTLWVYIGLTAVLYGAIRRHEPGFHVEFTRRDLGAVFLICIALVASFTGYTGWKLGW
ncbi:MAG: O-antigen ligase family protein [Deltaproteobacteria bacterium]|nr:O-antigen ligase family protein [Deltaproteobacteria bacterium]